VREAEAAGRSLTINTRYDAYRGITEVTIYTPDHPGLFSRIAGGIAVAGASVEGARIITLSNGMALDIFYIRDARGGPLREPKRLERLRAAIENTLAGTIKPAQELKKMAPTLPSRLDVFVVTPRVLIDNKASRRHTVVEVNGRDRPGLLYAVTQALTRQNLIIDSAKITTYGERAVDSFYVHDALGSKIEDETKLKRLRQRLLEALEAPPAPVQSAAAGRRRRASSRAAAARKAEARRRSAAAERA